MPPTHSPPPFAPGCPSNPRQYPINCVGLSDDFKNVLTPFTLHIQDYTIMLQARDKIPLYESRHDHQPKVKGRVAQLNNVCSHISKYIDVYLGTKGYTSQPVRIALVSNLMKFHFILSGKDEGEPYIQVYQDWCTKYSFITGEDFQSIDLEKIRLSNIQFFSIDGKTIQ